MKYWQEYYLAKHIEKQFGEINIGDLFPTYMHLKSKLGVNFNVQVLPNWCDTDAKLRRYGSQTTSQNMYTHGRELLMVILSIRYVAIFVQCNFSKGTS